MRRLPSLAQGTYYLVSGAWPLMAYRTFESVTGPKREPWLVKMVGLLTVVIGATVLRSGSSARGLGIGAAAAYATIDVWYAGVRDRIAPVYLLDALAELGIIGLWLVAGRQAGTASSRLLPSFSSASSRRMMLS